MQKVLFVTSFTADLRYLFYKTREVWKVSGLSDPTNVCAAVERGAYDLVLIDLALTGAFGPDLFRSVCLLPRHPPVFVLSRECGFPFQRLATTYGACGYLQIPFDPESLVETVSACLQSAGQEIRPPDTLSMDDAGGSLLVGDSPSMRRLRSSIHEFRSRTEPVLIVGETGSGKDLVARMVHRASPMEAGPYTVMNVSCISPTLAESTLFGSVRGGYTDAGDRKGLFEEADTGTLFLDEIAELELSLQPKLLRVLEDKQVTRLGSTYKREVRFRLVCATNRNIADRIASGLFREDLFHRLDVLRLEIPPLREHPEDIPGLAGVKLREYGKMLSCGALDKLSAHRWPGNVRQLFNCLARAACLSGSDVIQPEAIVF